MSDVDLSDLIGQDLGTFTVERLIGQGGMGSVFLGRHRMLGTPAAIKVLAPEYSQNPEMVARFEREARNAAALNHPNVVSVFDIGRTASGLIFMCMPFIEGRSLRAILDEGPMPLVEAMLLMDKILDAIAYAHARTVLHRDLKPDNIIITPEGYPRITDFGLARNMSSDVQLTQMGQVIGTPLYMPVEQWDAEDLDERTDIYALGITFYEMLCGKPPFPPDLQPGHLFRLVAAADFLKPREIDDELPEVVETVCLKMMALDANERYATAGEARDDLLAALQVLKDTAPDALTRRIDAAQIRSQVSSSSSVSAGRASGLKSPSSKIVRPGSGSGIAPKRVTPIQPAGSITPARRNGTPSISPIRPPGSPGSASASGSIIPPPPSSSSGSSADVDDDANGDGAVVGLNTVADAVADSIAAVLGEDVSDTGETGDVGADVAGIDPGAESAEHTAEVQAEVALANMDSRASKIVAGLDPLAGIDDLEDIDEGSAANDGDGGGNMISGGGGGLVAPPSSSSGEDAGDTLLSIGGEVDAIAKAAEDAFAALEAAAGVDPTDFGDEGDEDPDDSDDIVELTDDMATASGEDVQQSDDGWGPAEITEEERAAAAIKKREVTMVVQQALESTRDLPGVPMRPPPPPGYTGEDDPAVAGGTALSGQAAATTAKKKGCGAGVLLLAAAVPVLPALVAGVSRWLG